MSSSESSTQNPNNVDASGNIVVDLIHRAFENPIEVPLQNSDAAPHTAAVNSSSVPAVSNPPGFENAVIRTVTFWREGFSIGNGDLLSYNDPGNKWVLEEINAGRAPPSLFGVLPGQTLEVRVHNRTTENFVPAVRTGPVDPVRRSVPKPVTSVVGGSAEKTSPAAKPEVNRPVSTAQPSDGEGLRAKMTRLFRALREG